MSDTWRACYCPTCGGHYDVRVVPLAVELLHTVALRHHGLPHISHRTWHLAHLPDEPPSAGLGPLCTPKSPGPRLVRL